MGTVVDPSVEGLVEIQAPKTEASPALGHISAAPSASEPSGTGSDDAPHFDAPTGALQELAVVDLDLDTEDASPSPAANIVATAAQVAADAELPPTIAATPLALSPVDAEPERPSEPPPATGSLVGEMLGTSTQAAPLREPPSSSSPAQPQAFQRTGHPVRDRLMARAQLVSEQPRQADLLGDLTPFSALKEVENELDQIAIPRRAQTGGTGSLSPSTILTTGTLVGSALITLMFALLIQFAPRHSAAPASQPAPDPSIAPATPEALNQDSEKAEPKAPSGPKRPGPWRLTRASTGQQLVKGTIGRAAFLTALQDAGLSKTHAYQAFNALKEVANLDRCKPSNEFLALVDRQTSDLLAFEYIAGKEEIYQARRENGGPLVGKALDLKVEHKRVEGTFVVNSDSFAAALANTSLDPSIGRIINKALDGHTSVEQFKLGDRVRLVAQEVTVLGDFARYSGIEALEYVPANGSPLRVYYHGAKRKYYDSKGRAPGEGGWRKPIKGAPITSKFNPKRVHPILKKVMPHNGTDFGVPTGTPIHAASYGVVNKLGPLGPNGNFVGIQHAKDYETGYSHLSRFEPGLKLGDKVEALQVIGYVGSTGRSTGPHLHFSAKKKGVFIDPESLNLDALTVLPPSDRAAFETVRRAYDKELDAIALPQPLALPAPVAPAAPPEELDNETGEALVPQANPAAEPPSAAAAAVAAPANAPRVAVPPAAGRSLYLTDRELMETQSPSDDGEVDE